MPYDLKGRNVLVTGGSRGLGAIICAKFAAAGSNVAINYQSSKEAAETLAVQLSEEYSVQAFALQADQGIEEDCERMVNETMVRFGGIDVIVSNAGWTRFSSIPDLNSTLTSDWDTCFAVNVKAQQFLLRTALPTFNANPEGGVFLVTSSIAGIGTSGSSLPYCVTKAAQLQWMRCMAATQGPKVRVNAVLPGLLLTEWWYQEKGVDHGMLVMDIGKVCGARACVGQKFPKDVITQLEQAAKLKKVTDLEDCANAFIDLARNTSMTGQKITVDAGLCPI